MPGEVFILRDTNEPVTVLAVLDAAGTLLVRVEGEEPFQVARGDLETPLERHRSCGCC